MATPYYVPEESVPVQTGTVIGIEGDDFDFASLLRDGHIELTRAATSPERARPPTSIP